MNYYPKEGSIDNPTLVDFEALTDQVEGQIGTLPPDFDFLYDPEATPPSPDHSFAIKYREFDPIPEKQPPLRKVKSLAVAALGGIGIIIGGLSSVQSSAPIQARETPSVSIPDLDQHEIQQPLKNTENRANPVQDLPETPRASSDPAKWQLAMTIAEDVSPQRNTKHRETETPISTSATPKPTITPEKTPTQSVPSSRESAKEANPTPSLSQSTPKPTTSSSPGNSQPNPKPSTESSDKKSQDTVTEENEYPSILPD